MKWRSDFPDAEVLDIPAQIPNGVWTRLEGGRSLWSSPCETYFKLRDDQTGLESIMRWRVANCLAEDGWIDVSVERVSPGQPRCLGQKIRTQPWVPGRAGRREKALGRAVTVKAPMTGKVIKVLAKNGDKLDKGAPVLIIEAMKMENTIEAPAAGNLKGLQIDTGDSVAVSQKLFQVTPPGGDG